jgi:hypothetical protein
MVLNCASEYGLSFEVRGRERDALPCHSATSVALPPTAVSPSVHGWVRIWVLNMFTGYRDSWGAGRRKPGNVGSDGGPRTAAKLGLAGAGRDRVQPLALHGTRLEQARQSHHLGPI